MSDGFNTEDINKQFAELSEMLNAIKTQNALNIGDTSRMLNNLNSKIDGVAENIDREELLELIADLKHSLTDKYSYVTVKFSELETALKAVQNSGAEVVTVSQMKELFDVLSTNLTVFSKQVMNQGDILNEITLRIEALRTDDTNKREIIKNVNSIKSDLEKFNNGFESIILNSNNNFEQMMNNVAKLDPTTEVMKMSESVSDMRSTSDAILSAVQVVDQKQNKFDNTLDEIISQNTKINANIKALAGQSDFDGLVRKVEGSIELITALKGALTDANDQSQRSLLVQLDKLSAIVTKILTQEDFEIFKTELTKTVNDVIEATNVMRGDLIDTTTEFSSLAKLIEDLDLNTSFTTLKTLVEDKSREIKAGFVDAVSNINIEPIKNNLDLVIEKLEQARVSVNENSDKNAGNNAAKLDDLFALTDKVREIVTYLPEAIRQNYTSAQEGQKVFTEQCMKDLTSVGDKVKSLQEDISSVTSPLNETVVPEIQNLKEIVNNIKDLITNNEGVAEKITNLETIVGRVAGDYDVSLHSVQDNLISYMSGIKEDCESADIKMNNFAFEFNALKSELSSTFANFKEYSKGQNDRFNSVCNGLSSRFDSVMNALSTISEQPVAISGIKKGFDDVQNTMQDVLLAISDIKVSLSGSKRNGEPISDGTNFSAANDTLLKFENKINKIKDQLNFMSSDLMENIYNRSEKLLEEFEPVKKAVLSFVDVDFQNMAAILKDQTEAYKIGLEKLTEGIDSDDARPILNNLFNGLGSVENHINNLEQTFKDAMANSLVEIKDYLKMSKPFMPSAVEIAVDENADKLQNSYDGLEDLLDTKITDLKNDLVTRFENIHKHLDEAVIPKFADVDNKQNEILSKLNTLDDKEQLEELKNRLSELFDKISKVHDEVLNSKINTNALSQESLSGLNEEDKTVIVDFTTNLSELANLVKHTSDNIEEKITRALADNNIHFDLESFKADIEQMLSNIQVQTSDISAENTDNASASKVQAALEDYKTQIVNEINSVKQAISESTLTGEISEDLKVISQKVDLIAINDDVKSDIDKSLQEIRNTVKDQQKFLDTINILETLASLEDINKMKGLEQLSKLSDIISVDKLNALNKLTLLDKLKNLDCLDELQKIPKLSGMIEVQEQLKEIIAGLDKKINVFSKNYATLDIFMEEHKQQIETLKNEVSSAKTAIMKHVLNVFEQLSFVVEGEEIKDFVDEKTQEIHENIKNVTETLSATLSNAGTNNEALNQEIKTIKHAVDSMHPLERKDIEEFEENIKQNLTEIKSLSEGVSNTVSGAVTNIPEAVRAQVEVMVQQLNQLRVGSAEDDGDYSYSMQDVESDIAHLRLALDDVKKVVEENSLKEITDYVNEIVQQVESMKFNISQDDIFKMKVDIEHIMSDMVSISSRTNKLLLSSDESADALNTSMQSFRNTISDLYDGLKKLDYTEMTEKLEKIQAQVNENLKNNNETLEVMSKLSVRADDTEEKLSDVSDALNKLKKAMPSNESVLDELETKFAKQQQRIDALEEKIDELLAISDDKGSSNVSKKLTDIDKQLTRLNRSIERLTSYVDEE